MSNAINVFKTQQEIWKYVADGGAVICEEGTIVKFEAGWANADYSFMCPQDWSPYIEPVAKTKVWRWEKVITEVGFTIQHVTENYCCEGYANNRYPGYTKVPGSEREI